MSRETVNHETQPSTEKFDYFHDQLSGKTCETFERLYAANGEVVSVITRNGAQGHFLRWTSPEQTISELHLKPAPGAEPQPGSAQQLSKHLIVETSRTGPDGEEKRLRYHEYNPTGAECVINVNPTSELQYESTSEIDALTAVLPSLLENLKLVERSL